MSDETGDEEEHMRKKRQRRISGEPSSRRSSRIDPTTPMDTDTDVTDVKRGKKRSRSSTGSVEAAKIKKRSKNEPTKPVVEVDDIMSEVEARLKAKATRKKRRSSGDEIGEAKRVKIERTRKRRSSGLESGSDYDGDSRKKRNR